MTKGKYDWTDNPTESGIAPCNTDVLNDCLMHLKYESGSSGLELCDIGTALFVDETKGLRRRLNGQIVDINTNTQAFLTRLQEITTLYPSLVCTENEWQTIKTMSKLGQCGKFVYNYGTDGTTVTSVRLPAVVNINGLVDMANCGLIKNETLPNITGYIDAFVGSVTNTGVFSQYKRTANAQGATSQKIGVDFNASLSSSTYQNNAPVQQEAIQYPYFIQIATGQETENNIINDIQLNNPFSFGISQYFKGEMNNLSWLKSTGDYKPKGGYPSFYNWILTNANANKAGFKLSTASDITDYDFVVNTTNETFRLPLKNGMEGVFASGVKGNGISPTMVGLKNGSNTNFAYKTGDNYGFSSVISGSATAQEPVGFTTNASKSGLVVDKTVPDGWNLYYYVGETVQNTNLIDAGRIAEELTNKLDKSSIKAYVIQTYINGTSGYRIWSDGYCEQWGKTNYSVGGQTVTLLKEMKDTNYNVSTTIYYRGTFSTTGGSTPAPSCTAVSTTQIRISQESAVSKCTYWRVCGYLAEGEY